MTDRSPLQPVPEVNENDGKLHQIESVNDIQDEKGQNVNDISGSKQARIDVSN